MLDPNGLGLSGFIYAFNRSTTPGSLTLLSLVHLRSSPRHRVRYITQSERVRTFSSIGPPDIMTSGALNERILRLVAWFGSLEQLTSVSVMASRPLPCSQHLPTGVDTPTTRWGLKPPTGGGPGRSTSTIDATGPRSRHQYRLAPFHGGNSQFSHSKLLLGSASGEI